MDRQGGIRKQFEDGTALVIFTGDCAMECSKCTICHSEAEGVIARNPCNAQLGELVLVRTHRNKLLLAALVLFIQPIVSFFAGYWLGSALCGTGKVTGCVALTLGIGVSLVYDRWTASKRGSGYTVIKYPQNIYKGDN